ncbi:MAG: hypothetical protein V4759_06955 [Pseudomonadota bacterium]
MLLRAPTQEPAATSGAEVSKRAGILLLRLSPWVVFGPITGVLSELALRSHRRGRPVLAISYVVLNVAILLAIPALTAYLASRL